MRHVPTRGAIGTRKFHGQYGFYSCSQGSSSKSTTIIDCGITPAHLEFISDTTPIKQGRLSPGAFVAADGSWIVYPPELAIVS